MGADAAATGEKLSDEGDDNLYVGVLGGETRHRRHISDQSDRMDRENAT